MPTIITPSAIQMTPPHFVDSQEYPCSLRCFCSSISNVHIHQLHSGTLLQLTDFSCLTAKLEDVAKKTYDITVNAVRSDRETYTEDRITNFKDHVIFFVGQHLFTFDLVHLGYLQLIFIFFPGLNDKLSDQFLRCCIHDNWDRCP